MHEALGIYTHDVHCRWGSRLLAVVGAIIRGRLPVIGQPNADNPIWSSAPCFQGGAPL